MELKFGALPIKGNILIVLAKTFLSPPREDHLTLGSQTLARGRGLSNADSRNYLT